MLKIGDTGGIHIILNQWMMIIILRRENIVQYNYLMLFTIDQK